LLFTAGAGFIAWHGHPPVLSLGVRAIFRLSSGHTGMVFQARPRPLPFTTFTDVSGCHTSSYLRYEEEANRAQSKRIILATWKEVATVYRKQTLIYKTIIKPIWTYGIEIWGCASKSSQAILQKTRSKILRMITNAPWYVPNLTLHKDLKIPYVREVIFEKYAKHHRKLETRPNPLLRPLLDNGQPRRLKKTQSVDLL
jgi:hypothetical protein